MLNKNVLGHLEKIDLIDINVQSVNARVDSGAHTSAIWVSSVVEIKNGIKVVFFDKTSDLYTGDTILFKNFDFMKIKSSNGLVERRYKVQLKIKIRGDIIKTWFTLADRSKLKYPVLIGRNILMDRFLVDVSLDLHNIEKATK